MIATEKPIGGFFELELLAKRTLYHDTALALANGRVCFKVIVERVKPTKVYLPFYCCDSLILPLKEAGIPYEFYAIVFARYVFAYALLRGFATRHCARCVF